MYIGEGEELYSFDRYKDCKIYAVTDGYKYHYEVIFNGTVVYNLSSYNAESGLQLVKLWIDKTEDV